MCEWDPLMAYRLSSRQAKSLEEWEEDTATGTRVLKKIAKSRKKKVRDD